MTVEESMGGEIDRFPIGMRVLAVDDDPTCLMLLDGLLRKCQYQVTTASQARSALKMLRENRNRFDLIISDVHMPDMDGFKLLELVGLEMDLPVIMLSANSDPKLVMKGITHGACDYLVKPVRLEELRNIWQHVIRKKKVDPKSQTKSTSQDKSNQGSEGGQDPSNADQNVKINRKRKDEEEEGDDNGNESEDPSSQKKPRVVWSIDLHRKFVAAVNQLGIEKAVPKRILDLMNVEGLTRENVASHLQKYRLYLKRISMQQANMVATFGGKDASYIRMGSIEGIGDFRTLTGSGRLPNAALSSYPPSGILGRLNSPSGVSLHGLAPSSLIQPSHTQNLSNSINSIGKFQPVVSSAGQNTNLFSGISSSFDLDQLQPSKSVGQIGDFNSISDPRIFTTVSTFPDSRVTAGISNNSLPSVSTNPLILQGNPQTGGGFMNQSSLKVASLGSESFNLGSSCTSNFLDQGRCNESWQSAMQPSKISPNPLPLNENFHDQLPSNGLRFNNSNGFSSNTAVPLPLEDSRSGSQGGLVGDVAHNMNQSLNQKRGPYTQYSSNAFSTLASLVPANGGVGQTKDQNSVVYSRGTDALSFGRSNGGASMLVQHSDNEKSTMESKLRSNGDYLLEQTKLQGGFVANGYDSLDDLMHAMMKREQDGTTLMDGEFGFDAYTFGSCI